MKEILMKKRKLEQHERGMLNEEYTAIVQNKLPLKLKDPGNFTISYTIRNYFFRKALCDFGARLI